MKEAENMVMQGDRKRVWAGAGVLLGLGLLLLVQWIAGNLPIELFRFPLNLILLLIWVWSLVALYRRCHESKGVQWLLSMSATRLSLLFLVVIGLFFGLQTEPAATSWPVVGMLLFVQSVLGLVILRGWRNEQGVRYAFLLNHVGLWLALVGAFWGAPDREELRVAVEREVATREAYRPDGSRTLLAYEMRLREFYLTTYADGSPSSFEAEVEVAGKEVSLRVNHPYQLNFGEAVYLISYDRSASSPRYCIVEVVREPWRGVTLVGIGMMILGALSSFLVGHRGPEKPTLKTKNE